MTKLQSEMANTQQQVRDVVDGNNNSNNEGNTQTSASTGGCGGKYLLRPRSVRVLRRCDNEWNSLQDNRRQKSRPAPLSKYRRKTANTRERYRMRQINTAFEKLRKILPSCGSPRGNSTEMTKITTLKYACAYIRSLQNVLGDTVTQHRLEGEDTRQESCQWMFSGVLQEGPLLQGALGNTCHASQGKTQQLPAQNDTEMDLMSLLCDSTDSGIFDDSLGSYLTPMNGADEVTLLLLGSDTSSWHDQTHTQFAVC